MDPLSAYCVCVLSALKKNLMTVFQAHNGAVVVLQQCRNCNKSPHLVLSPLRDAANHSKPQTQEIPGGQRAQVVHFYMLQEALQSFFLLGAIWGRKGRGEFCENRCTLGMILIVFE